MKSMESVIIRSKESSTIIMGAGDNFLIAAIMKENVDPVKVSGQILAVAKDIGEAI